MTCHCAKKQTKQSSKKHIKNACTGLQDFNQNTHEIKSLEIAIEEVEAKLNYKKITGPIKPLSDNPERINVKTYEKAMAMAKS